MGIQKVVDERTDKVGDFRQDADNLALFSVLQLFEFVIGIENLRGFDEDGLAGGGLVVHKAMQTTFELCGDGDAEAAVADGHLSILLHDAVLLGGGEDFADLSVGVTG